jgi:hypothetical protein
MGQIMYTHRYPSAEKLPDSAMPGARTFTIMIEDTLSSSKTLRAEQIVGGTGERGFYDWSKMKDEVLFSSLLNEEGFLPLNASLDLDLSGDKLEQQHEMAIFLRDIGCATRSTYVLSNDVEATKTSVKPDVIAPTLKDVFHYRNAEYYGT